jgi:hypothetical protein
MKKHDLKWNELVVVLNDDDLKRKALWLEHNQIRKYRLFERLNSEIERFVEEYQPIFTEDEELLWLMENFQRRMKELEESSGFKSGD